MTCWRGSGKWFHKKGMSRQIFPLRAEAQWDWLVFISLDGTASEFPVSRVGEKATQRARPTLPSSNRRCRFPASVSPASSCLRHTQYAIDGPAPTRQVLQPLLSLRRAIWPLAAAFQVLDQTVQNVAFDLTVLEGYPKEE